MKTEQSDTRKETNTMLKPPTVETARKEVTALKPPVVETARKEVTVLKRPAIETTRKEVMGRQARGADRLTNLIRTARVGDQAIAEMFAAVGVHVRIDRIEPSPIVENRPARVYFTVWNNTTAETIGYVRADVQPAKSLASYPADFYFEIRHLRPHQTTCGVLTFKAPRCDRFNVLTVAYWTPGTPTAGVEFVSDVLQSQDEMQFDVAARYSLTADRVTIWDTASFHNDTLYMAVNGSYGSTASAEKQFLGDHNNGTFSVPFAGIGPFDSIPDVSPDVAIAWNLANQGHDVPIDKILDAISDVGAAVATAIAGPEYAPISAAVDALHHLVIDYLWQDCDCIVDMGAQNFTSKQLYDQTFDPSDKKIEAMDWKRDHNKYGPCRTSDYNVRWCLTRYRQPWEVPAMQPDHVMLAYNQPVCIVPLTSTGETPLWEWDIVDGDGRVDNNGCFMSPPSPGLCPYAVIRATGLVDGTAKYRGYAVVMLM